MMELAKLFRNHKGYRSLYITRVDVVQSYVAIANDRLAYQYMNDRFL